MNHSNTKRTFSREKGQRDALLKTLSVSLIKLGKITTTEAKASSLRSIVEKLVTKGREGTLNSHRLLAGKIGTVAANKIVKDIAPKYKDRKGGYLRITKLSSRINDGAKMVQIEFV